jgi:drug/metabolite transporter (DMT)-like permease
MTDSHSHDRRANLRGIGFMLFAVAAFAALDAALKVLAGHYPPMQVAALRGLSSLPIVLVWALATVPIAALWRIRWPLHLLRGAISIGMLAAFAYALRRMGLAEAYAIFFVAPLLITALAAPILGERVGAARWLAIAVGLIGVLVILRPSGAGMAGAGLAGLAVLGTALAYAISALTVRVLARSDSTQAMVLWMTALLALGAGASALPDWQPLQWEHALPIGLMAVAGSLGQYAVTEAFRHGEASVVAPFEYTALLWGIALDALFWQLRPHAHMLVGAAIVIGAGIYLIRREQHPQPIEPP